MRSPNRFCFTAIMLCCFIASVQAQTNYATSFVNPFIGTGGHGHTFPGACVPNGLVQLSPDTRPDGNFDWDGCGGYHHSDSLIYGFSHTHLSGTGVADLCDVLLMPMSGKYSVEPVEYRSPFSHEKETAHAGYYSVFLEDEATKVELTATAHCGMHRYTMPKEAEQFIVLDLLHRDGLRNTRIARNGQEITGERRSGSWAKDQRLFYCIRIARESGPCSFGMETLDSTRAVIAVKREDVTPIIVKVSISAVSVEGARANLDAEIPGWDFDVVRKQAEDAWNAKLGKIQVTGGTPEQQRIFYTALYHCYVAPYIFNDVDGKYRGMDGEVHHADHNVYTVFSLWDTFRALHPLMTILEPEMTSDFIKTFLLHYKDGGRLPVWELWGNETDCMIGYHSVSVIADAYMKGIRDFDEVLALRAMMAGATRDEPGLNALTNKGFISSEDQSESVSKTLEYAYDDRCIVSMASEVNIPDGVLDGWKLDMLNDRGLAFENLFDPTTGFFRARRNGGFVPSFDPFEVNFNYTEANAWQYSLFAPQDIDGLIALHGGELEFEQHLDKLFSASTSTSGRDQADITGLVGQYAHGNEPSHHMAYLYNRVGKPEKTRTMVKRIMAEHYHDAPDGLSGNEDCGQMSAWYVMSALGLYQIAPGINPEYDLGYPLFDKAMIAGSGETTFSLEVQDSTWVQLDEAGWQRSIATERKRNKKRIAAEQWEAPPKRDLSATHYSPTQLDHEQIIAGGRFAFDVERVPEPRRKEMMVLDGAYIRECPRPGAPVIQAVKSSFTDSLVVTVEGCGTCTVRDAVGQRACPMNEPFVLTNTAHVEVKWSEAFQPVTARFTKIDGDITMKLGTPYANQYAAGGDNALIDGQRGGRDFRTGEWQGTQGQDVLATIDLGRVKKLKRIGVGMLQDQASWIFYPELIEVAWSTTGRTWSSTTAKNSVKRDVDGSMIMDLFTEAIDKKAQFIKIRVQNGGVCPEWHRGKGGASWLFLDEVLIEAEW
ncbi:MAG: GH92 family glycosyl hydrolase [Flavobacteriales bacterium]|nr:GH92 family glycosyl hydrolase [Flavobacteriales bacterium]